MKMVELTSEEAEIIKSLRASNKEKAKNWTPQRSFDQFEEKAKIAWFDQTYHLAIKELERLKFKESTTKGKEDIYYWVMNMLGDKVFLNCIDCIELKGII